MVSIIVRVKVAAGHSYGPTVLPPPCPFMDASLGRMFVHRCFVQRLTDALGARNMRARKEAEEFAPVEWTQKVYLGI